MSTETLRNPLSARWRWTCYQASTWCSVAVVWWTTRDVAVTALTAQAAFSSMAAANVVIQGNDLPRPPRKGRA